MTEEFIDISLTEGGEILPPKNNKIALIDADTIVFASAASCEYFIEHLPQDMLSEEEWTSIITDPGYDSELCGNWLIDIDEAMEYSMEKINIILDKTGCKDFQLHFTAGRESFRYTKVDIDYKSNRLVDSQGVKTRAPQGLYALKQEFVRRYKLKSTIWTECEADDAVWWLGDRYPDKYIVCAVDKDVLGATKAEAFNYFSRAAYTHPKSGKKIPEKPMKFQRAEEPELFWYYQCLTGDKGDGIIGIHGMGPVKAKKLLANTTSDKERWDKIVEAYEKADMSMLEALNNMRMVRLDQFNPETMELRLWDPRKI